MDWLIWIVFLILLLFFILFLINRLRMTSVTQYYIQNVGTGGYLVLVPIGSDITLNNYISASGSIGDMYSQWLITTISGTNVTLTNAFTGISLNYASATSGTILSCTSSVTQNMVFFNQVKSSNGFYFQSVQNNNLVINADFGDVLFPNDSTALYLSTMTPIVGAQATTGPGIADSFIFTFTVVS
jgi:hypothetical protein